MIDSDSPEILQAAKHLVVLANAATTPAEVNGAFFVTVPNGHTHKDITGEIEKAQDVPSRKRGTVQLGNVESLLAYCADQKAEDLGYIYADPDAREIVAVFNDHRASDFGGWRDHRASFKALYTPEFDKWLRNDKQHKTQAEFSEFIEDNIADIQGEDAQTLLSVATTIQASTGINFSSARRLQDGQVQLTYHETIDAKAGADGSMKIPQTFTLGLRIFKGDQAGYKLTARLKYRLAGGSVKFWYEFDRVERAVEDAFAGYVATVREKSGYVVLVGKP